MMAHSHRFSLCSFLAVGSASAALVSFQGGDTASGTLTGTPGNAVIDFGYRVPLINTTDPVLFETGGDGIGFMLAQVGSNLRVFQDQNTGAETSLTLDISAFAGQIVSIRLDGNFSLADGSRVISLDVVPTTGSAVGTFLDNITAADSRLSGSDGTGFGGINGSLAGNGEAPSGVQGFDTAERDLAGPGSSVLGPNSLLGTIYTGADADTHRGTAIPDPGSYGLVPEPSSGILLLLGGFGLLSRRHR